MTSKRRWPTEAEINAKRTPAGGWKRKDAAAWGVPWPLPQGWRQALIDRDQVFFDNPHSRGAGRKGKKQDSDRVPDDGERPPCRNCDQPLQRWRHGDHWTPQQGKEWYLWWLECLNSSCRTKQVMPAEARMLPGQKPPPSATASAALDPLEELLSVEDAQRLAHFRTI